MLFVSYKCYCEKDLHDYGGATVRREVEPEMRHTGVGGGPYIIHNRCVYLDRKGVSLNQNGHESLRL